jgi:hypothetical protein
MMTWRCVIVRACYRPRYHKDRGSKLVMLVVNSRQQAA